MGEFKYVATKRTGEKVEGVTDADTREKVVDFLHEQDLIVVSIDEKVGIDFKKLGSFQIGGVPLKEKVFFTKQLSTMLDAGLPLTQALDILTNQVKNQSLKEKLVNVLEEVKGGNTLSSAFSKYPTFFNNVEVNLIKAGEESGNLSELIQQVSIDMEKTYGLQGKIRGAMIYPAVILVAIVVVLFVMLTFMIPAVQDLYAGFDNAKLPFVTQILVDIATFIRTPVGLLTIFGTVLFSVVGYKYYSNTPGGRSTIDEFMLKIPVFGELNTKTQLTQMTRLVAMLLKSGVPIVDTLKIVSTALGNVHFRKVLEDAAADVTKGIPFAVPVSKSKFVPIIVSQMIATGEETGKLDQVLKSLSEFYESEVNEITNNLTKLMEPLLLLFVGALVGFLAVAIYLPIYQLGQVIK